MKKIFVLGLIVAFSSCSNDGGQEAAFTYDAKPETAGFSTERLARVDSLLSRAIEIGELPNAATFVARNGKVVHHKTFGYSNIEQKKEASTDDIFRIASQTKAITTAALMTLYEEGLFLLDDPLHLYLPEFRRMQVLTEFSEKDTSFTARPAKRAITIRHLLTHTSGIHYGILGQGMGNMMYSKAGIPAVNSLDSITAREVARRISELPLLFDPGEKYLYGMNTDVVGALIEELSGQRLDTFITQRILEPLGMNDTHFYLPEDKAHRLVELYTPGDNGLEPHSNEVYRTYPVAGAKAFLSGGAGLCGTIEDYARFCQTMLNKGAFNGKRILSRKTVELMTVNQIGDLDIGRGLKFGLGFELRGDYGIRHHLGSGGAYRWGGMYYTDYLIDPDEDMILLFYTNLRPRRGRNYHELFQNMVYQALE